jgi:NAD-dependent SIR2 family protein deacetylase
VGMKKVVFILGAGASVPYGYPTGEELNKSIVLSLINEERLFQMLTTTFQNQTVEIKKFPQDLKRSLRNSIDQFLVNKPQYEGFGKFAITHIIKSFENDEKRHYYLDRGDWVKYFFNQFIGLNENEIRQREFQFITFNYDRSLEFLLTQAFKHGFEKDDAVINRLLYERIYHIHGSLGDLPIFSKTQRIPFNLERTAPDYCHEVYEMSKNINVMYERRQPTIDESVRDKIYIADKIFFLGFGFDKDNFNRLNIDWELVRGEIFATGFLKTTLEMERIKKMFKDKNIVIQDCDCHNLLRMYLDFEI